MTNKENYMNQNVVITNISKTEQIKIDSSYIYY